MEIVLEAQHTHLYPGHEGWVAGDMPVAGGEGMPARIAFADGVMAAGTLSAAGGDRWELAVAPYRTGAGSEIAAKRWQMAFSREADGRTRFRVKRKLAARKD